MTLLAEGDDADGEGEGGEGDDGGLTVPSAALEAPAGPLAVLSPSSEFVLYRGN